MSPSLKRLSPVPAPTSLPRPKRTPWWRWRAIAKMPLARKALLDGQWAMLASAACRRVSSSSETCTSCAKTERLPTRPVRSYVSR
jgi:hypothetical protein